MTTLASTIRPCLLADSVPPQYGRRVLAAYRRGKLTSSRVQELLWGTLGDSKLPTRDEVPIAGFSTGIRTLEVMTTLVFDNSPLSHFALAGRLTELACILADFSCVVPVQVREEIMIGMHERPDLEEIIIAQWLKPVELTTLPLLMDFAGYKTELGGGLHKNNGEAAVLAWAKNHGATAIIDERPATRIARRDEIAVRGSLSLVIEGFRAGILRRHQAEEMVDELVETGRRLPVNGKGLFAYAYEEGLLP